MPPSRWWSGMMRRLLQWRSSYIARLTRVRPRWMALAIDMVRGHCVCETAVQVIRWSASMLLPAVRHPAAEGGIFNQNTSQSQFVFHYAADWRSGLISIGA